MLYNCRMHRLSTAIILGLASGMVFTIVSTGDTPSFAERNCQWIGDTHRVVRLSTFLGDTYTCMNNRYR